MRGVVASISNGTYRKYTKATGVFAMPQVIEGPQVVLINSEDGQVVPLRTDAFPGWFRALAIDAFE
jgi:hypothetical protein